MSEKMSDSTNPPTDPPPAEFPDATDRALRRGLAARAAGEAPAGVAGRVLTRVRRRRMMARLAAGGTAAAALVSAGLAWQAFSPRGAGTGGVLVAGRGGNPAADAGDPLGALVLDLSPLATPPVADLQWLAQSQVSLAELLNVLEDER